MNEIYTKEYIWKLDFRVPAGEVYGKFFDGLKDKKILANKCSECARIYVPPKFFCEMCYAENKEWLQVEPRGTLQTFSITYRKFLNFPDPPYITGIIRIDGSATNLMHFIGGIKYEDPMELPSKVKIGMEVEPVWAEERTGDILDIKYFKPIQ